MKRIKFLKIYQTGTKLFVYPEAGELLQTNLVWTDTHGHCDYSGPNPDNYSDGDPFGLPVYTISNINVEEAGSPVTKPGDIYWIKENTPFVIKGDVTDTNSSNILPTDGTTSKLIIMFERLIDDITAGDDVRVIADITADVSGQLKLTINIKFANTGNYCIKVDRLNRGLERINKNYRIDMEPELIEFDVYIEGV